MDLPIFLLLYMGAVRMGDSFLHPMPLEKGGEHAEYHFKRIVAGLWPEDGPKPFVFHPWAERMLEAACANKYLAVAGCASIGKADFYAVWAIVNFIAGPYDTMVLVISTSLKDSRKRIWGSNPRLLAGCARAAR